jgi:hypothetical protein
MFQTTVLEKIKIYFMLSDFFSKNRAVHEIKLMPKNVVETVGPQMTSEYGAYA